MHELSVANAMVDRAREVAADHDAERVEQLTVELGEASHVNPDQFRRCLKTVAGQSSLGDAEVVIEAIEPRATCDCGWEGEPPSFEGSAAVVPAARCPECNSRTEFTQGRECRLASIEISD